ncbi:uncharacterized protein [Magallana gigas]|uniref:uncharacterized protein isoform X1 n=1 Tax=Magallana gigas TaxID=29159 RepID=UPI0033400FC2
MKMSVILILGICSYGVLGAPPPRTYNPAIYENLNIPKFNPNAISFVNYNPMKEQNLEPFSIGFQAITTKAPEYIKVKNLDYSGGGRMTFDMSNVKFDPNNGNFMRDFDPNSFSNKEQSFQQNQVVPFQENQVTESPRGHSWDGRWPGQNKEVENNKEQTTGRGSDFGFSMDSKGVGVSGKSWDGSWPDGDKKDFSVKATDSWKAAVGADKKWNEVVGTNKNNQKWQDSVSSGDFSEKATQSWSKALNADRKNDNYHGNNVKSGDIDEIIQSLMAALQRLQSY